MCLNCVSKIHLEPSLSCKYAHWLVNINAAFWLQLWEDFIVVLVVFINLQKVSQHLLYLFETYRTAASKGCYKKKRINHTLYFIVFNLVCASLMFWSHSLWNSRDREGTAWYFLVLVFSRQCWSKRNICHVFLLFSLIVMAIYPRADMIAMEGNGAKPFT